MVIGDDVEFAGFAPPVAFEDAHAVAAKVVCGEVFAEGAQAQVRWKPFRGADVWVGSIAVG